MQVEFKINKVNKDKKVKDKISLKEKTKKSKADEFIMPNKENYMSVLSKNYTIKQLKDIIVHYKIKLEGASVKSDIISKINNYFKLYDKAFIIQNAWRRSLFKQYNKLRGPARFNRKICVNDTDFFTIDDLHSIPYNQFFSFMDIDNMIYGFDIMSIYNLFNKSDKPTNPYNRNPFPKSLINNLLQLIRLSKIFKEPINLDMNEGEKKNPLVNFENRLLSLFSDIDHLGNYTNYNWFMNLNQVFLIRFLTEIQDIWCYRSNIPEIVKREICPNHLDLFQRMHMIELRYANVTVLREIAIEIMSKLVRDGINESSRSLGANLVLCALTLVSSDAAEAMPWFYESVI
jgi:hypothetical protein